VHVHVNSHLDEYTVADAKVVAHDDEAGSHSSKQPGTFASFFGEQQPQDAGEHEHESLGDEQTHHERWPERRYIECGGRPEEEARQCHKPDVA
jgi:hypothetical protein